MRTKSAVALAKKMRTVVPSGEAAAPVATNKRVENRRENLRRLIQQHNGPKAFSERMGYKTPSFLVQMAGPNPSRPVTEDTARAIEEKLGLPEGSLDWPSNGARPAAQHNSHGTQPTANSSALDADIVRMLAAVWDEDKIELPVVKFGQIAAYAISDAAETGSTPSPDKLRRLIELLK